MKLGKKDIIIIILIILIVGIFLSIVLFGKTKDDNSKRKYDYKQFNTIDISSCYKKSCNEVYRFNNNEVKITQDNDLNYQLNVNGKNILSGSGVPYLEPQIYAFDNDMIISTNYEDTETLVSYIYSSKNEELNSITVEETDPRWIYKSIEVKDNVITYNLSRFTIGDSIEDSSKKETVKIDSCATYTEYKDLEVSRVYEAKYENGVFGKPVLKKEVKLKDYKNYSKLCN